MLTTDGTLKGLCVSFSSRKLDQDCRAAMAAIVFSPDPAPVCVYDAPADRQPESGACRLSREERLKYVASDGLWHPRTGIGNLEQDPRRAGRLCAGYPDVYLSALSHRLESILENIQEQLLEL